LKKEKEIKIDANDSSHTPETTPTMRVKNGVENYLQTLLDTLPVAITLKDKRGSYLHVNKTYSDWVGIDIPTLLGMSVHDTQLPLLAREIGSYDKKIFDEGIEIVEEVELKGKGGVHTVILHKKPVFGENDEVLAVSTVATDISNRKLVEDALYFIAQRGWEKSGSEFFDSLTRYLAEIFDLDYVFIGKLMKDEKNVQTMSLFAMGEYPGDIQYALKSTPCENVVGQELCYYRDSVQHLFPEDELLVEMDVEGYMGIPLWSSQKIPIGLIVVMDQKPIDSKKILRSVLQVVAVRAAHELEQISLNEEKEELEQQLRRTQKMKIIDQLTSGISHDFNNILSVVIGNLEAMEEHLKGNVQAQSFLDKAMAGAERGATITRKLLSYTREDAAELSIVSLNDKIEELEELLRRSLSAEIEIQTELSDNLWLVSVDTGDFADAILNLSLNARDAMTAGGTLVIRTTNEDAKCRGADLQKTGDQCDYVVVSIIDTGDGIDDETQTRMFEPFFTTKSADKGTGLGLSMVHGFVHRSNGYIDIKSTVGVGTSFSIYLPRVSHKETSGKKEP